MTRRVRKIDSIRRTLVRTRADKAYFELAFMRVSVANLLHEMREAAGLTQQQLASLAQMSQPEISRLEGGGGTHAPGLATVVRFAKVCGFGLTLTATSPRRNKRLRNGSALLSPTRR